jgi:CRP/FNR family transcriptional regulator, cyclic AMP receptor protein
MSWEDLGRVPLFATLSLARLRELERLCPARHVQPGAVLARRGDQAKNLIILTRGRLSGVHNGAAGETVRLPLAVGPCVVDKATVLSGANHAMTWTACTESTILIMDRDLLQCLIDTEPTVRNHALRFLATQAVRSQWDRIQRETLSTAARIAGWLLEQSGRRQLTIQLTAGQQGLAEELGLSRVTVNRVLQALARSGAVRVRRGAVVVLDADVLAATASGKAA